MKSYGVIIQINLFSSTFVQYHLFSNILQNEIWNFC